MFVAIRALFFLSITIGITSAARDWKAELKKDLVVISGDKMTMDEVQLLSFKQEGSNEEKKVQVKIHSEGPPSIVSRDNFVAVSTMVSTEFLAEMADGAEFDIEDLEEVIGKPDLEINLYLAKEGLQFEVVDGNTNQKTKHTEKWEQIFADE